MLNSKLPANIDNDQEQEKEYKILDEMWRLGFLADESKFSQEELAIIRQQVALEGQLESFYKSKTNNIKLRSPIINPTAVLKPGDDSKQFSQKKMDWHNKQLNDIFFLGRGVSSGLNHKTCDFERLTKFGLTNIESVAVLANKMGVNLQELRFLAFSKRISKVKHYCQFEIAKKPSGSRRISAPMPRLKRLQYWILDNILDKVCVHPAAHGFVKGRSIVSNATPHVGSELVVNLDLKDFFPSISYVRVKGLFRSFGYSDQLATVFALLCTEHDFDEVKLQDELFYICQGQRKLPQGSPASPAISNLICRMLDKRLTGLAKQLKFTYTRYADDLTFSSKERPVKYLQKLLWRSRKIIEDEGFILHADKTRIMRKHQCQTVTGLVVNDKLSISRKLRKNFRALTYQLEKKKNLKKVHWHTGKAGNLINSLVGYANFMNMVVANSGQRTLACLKLIDNKVMLDKADNKVNDFRQKSAQGLAPRQDWWGVEALESSHHSVSNVQKQSDRPVETKSSEQNKRASVDSSLTRPQKNIQLKTELKKAKRSYLLAALFCIGFAFAVYFVLR